MPYNILLVDDDSEFREELGECLEDYRIIEAACGSKALEILSRPNEIDLVILDIKLPGRNGTEILTEIKHREPDLGVIMLTGHSSKYVAIASLKGNADDYFEKPVDIKKLMASIHRLLHAKGEWGEMYPPDAEGKIERIKYFLDRNYDKRVSLEDVAELVCLSPKYLSRLFKQRAGIGFNEYRLGKKMEKAKEILTETGLTINEISYRLGYRNMESFIRMFKKFTGTTPTTYRESQATDGQTDTLEDSDQKDME
jgi:YesN/AraC family two-component response regulator